MIEFKKALNIMVDHAPGPPGVEEVPIYEAIGRTVAENIFCNVEMPPFNKSAMDGFAVRAADVEKTPATFDVVMDIPAGDMPSKLLEPGQAAAVMTGAPIPEGADTVIKVELTSGFGNEKVTINEGASVGHNISPRGEILKKGEIILRPGTRIGTEEVGLLSAIGRDPVPVFSKPTAAVISTGDELVPPAQKELGPAQIRDSNGPALMGYLREMGLEPVFIGRVKDNEEAMRKAVAKGLKHDILLISGGVSAGTYDFIEDVLAKLEVRVHVRRIAVKPGKPTVFGTRYGKIVFGLPGNPVSAIVIARLLVTPVLHKQLGLLHNVRSHYTPPTVKARLLEDIRKKTDRLWFVTGYVNYGQEITVRPLKGRGSADLPNAAHGNCLITAPKEDAFIEKGSLVDVVLWNRSLR
jgi:molybdopterin molybdotransferase